MLSLSFPAKANESAQAPSRLRENRGDKGSDKPRFPLSCTLTHRLHVVLAVFLHADRQLAQPQDERLEELRAPLHLRRGDEAEEHDYVRADELVAELVHQAPEAERRLGGEGLEDLDHHVEGVLEDERLEALSGELVLELLDLREVKRRCALVFSGCASVHVWRLRACAFWCGREGTDREARAMIAHLVAEAKNLSDVSPQEALLSEGEEHRAVKTVSVAARPAAREHKGCTSEGGDRQGAGAAARCAWL